MLDVYQHLPFLVQGPSLCPLSRQHLALIESLFSHVLLRRKEQIIRTGHLKLKKIGKIPKKNRNFKGPEGSARSTVGLAGLFCAVAPVNTRQLSACHAMGKHYKKSQLPIFYGCRSSKEMAGSWRPGAHLSKLTMERIYSFDMIKNRMESAILYRILYNL